MNADLHHLHCAQRDLERLLLRLRLRLLLGDASLRGGLASRTGLRDLQRKQDSSAMVTTQTTDMTWVL